MGVQLHSLLTSALDEVSGQLHLPAALARTHWIGGLVDPRTYVDTVANRTPTPLSSMPRPIHYTVCIAASLGVAVVK
jgi:hypothetical protein